MPSQNRSAREFSRLLRRSLSKLAAVVYLRVHSGILAGYDRLFRFELFGSYSLCPRSSDAKLRSESLSPALSLGHGLIRTDFPMDSVRMLFGELQGIGTCMNGQKKLKAFIAAVTYPQRCGHKKAQWRSWRLNRFAGNFIVIECTGGIEDDEQAQWWRPYLNRAETIVKCQTAITLNCFIALLPVCATAESDCAPAVQLKGDGSAVEVITDLLLKNGIRTEPGDDCPLARAEIHTSDKGLVVRVEDSEGRQTERIVVDPESAASIIESWIRSDLIVHMLLPGSKGGIHLASDGEDPPAKTKEGSSPNSDLLSPLVLIDLGFDLGVGFDGSTWLGGDLSGCFVVGPECLGATLRINSDPGLSGDSKLLQTNRLMLDLLASVGFPLFFDKFTLRPGIEAGTVFLRITKIYSEDSAKRLIEYRGWAFAVGAHLVGALALGRGFSILTAVSVVILPAEDTASLNNGDTWLAGSLRGLAHFVVGLEYSL